MNIIRNANVLGHADLVLLEKNNQDIKYKNAFFNYEKGVTRLMLLVLFLHKHHKITNIIKEYIKEIPEEINKISKNYWNALDICIAISKDDFYIEAVKILLNGGADVNQVDNYGCVSLHIAASYSNLLMAKLILEYDGINIKDSTNSYPVDLCSDKIKFNKILDNITLLNTKN